MESQKGGILSINNDTNGFEKMASSNNNQMSLSVQQSVEDLTKEYEKMLQKLEADIRGHIRVRK